MFDRYKEAIGAMRAAMAGLTDGEDHVWRVVCTALRLWETEPEADLDVVVLSALLHDIGRGTPGAAEHAEQGAALAERVLLAQSWPQDTTRRVAQCIRAHSRGSGPAPQSIEAKILYDADKLDMLGLSGAARQLRCSGALPLQYAGPWGEPKWGARRGEKCAVKKIRKKAKEIAAGLFTKEGNRLGKERVSSLNRFIKCLKKETENTIVNGHKILNKYGEN